MAVVSSSDTLHTHHPKPATENWDDLVCSDTWAHTDAQTVLGCIESGKINEHCQSGHIFEIPAIMDWLKANLSAHLFGTVNGVYVWSSYSPVDLSVSLPVPIACAIDPKNAIDYLQTSRLLDDWKGEECMDPWFYTLYSLYCKNPYMYMLGRILSPRDLVIVEEEVYAWVEHRVNLPLTTDTYSILAQHKDFHTFPFVDITVIGRPCFVVRSRKVSCDLVTMYIRDPLLKG